MVHICYFDAYNEPLSLPQGTGSSDDERDGGFDARGPGAAGGGARLPKTAEGKWARTCADLVNSCLLLLRATGTTSLCGTSTPTRPFVVRLHWRA